MPNFADEAFYSSEQRKFRRLEVRLPVWIVEADAFDNEERPPWALGYTGDISAEGTKVIVPRGQEERWQKVSKSGQVCFLRYDVPGMGEVEYVSGLIRRAGHDVDSGESWLGVEYEPGADEVKSQILRAGLATVHTRRRLYGMVACMAVLVVLSLLVIQKLQADVRSNEKQIQKLRMQQTDNKNLLQNLLSPSLVSSRAEGIDSAFRSQKVRERIDKLTADMNRLNKPGNQTTAERERAQKRENDGIQVSSTPRTGATINLGVAYPYGFAWPQVTADLEELIGRRVPTVVIFRDFKSPFPIEDCREARLRAKTLQITWEPWYFSNPDAVKLWNISRGKYDNYIDSWAHGAKSYGNELWIRFGHEFNGNWYPWSMSANNKKSKNYIEAFRHIHDRFKKAGADNVRWIWCFNAESVPDTDWNDPLRAYPGDGYVDMISIDGYNFGNTTPNSRWMSFREIFGEPYSRVTGKFKKPVMIGEVGCASSGGDKADWIRGMDRAIRTRFPKIQGLVWFEAVKEADWRMASSLDSLKASHLVWGQEYYRRGEP